MFNLRSNKDSNIPNIPNISIQKIGKNQQKKDLKSTDVHSGFRRKLFKASEKTGHILPRLFSAITGMVLGTLYTPRFFYDFPKIIRHAWRHGKEQIPLWGFITVGIIATSFPFIGFYRGGKFFEKNAPPYMKSFINHGFFGDKNKSYTSPLYLFYKKERQEKADQSILYKLGRILKSYKIKLQKLMIPTPEQIKETIIEKYQIKNKILNQLNEYESKTDNQTKIDHFDTFKKGIRIEVNQENKIEEKKNKKEDIDAFQVKIDFGIDQKLNKLKALNNLIEEIDNKKITTIEGLRQHINKDSEKKEGVELSDTENFNKENIDNRILKKINSYCDLAEKLGIFGTTMITIDGIKENLQKEFNNESSTLNEKMKSQINGEKLGLHNEEMNRETPLITETEKPKIKEIEQLLKSHENSSAYIEGLRLLIEEIEAANNLENEDEKKTRLDKLGAIKPWKFIPNEIIEYFKKGTEENIEFLKDSLSPTTIFKNLETTITNLLTYISLNISPPKRNINPEYLKILEKNSKAPKEKIDSCKEYIEQWQIANANLNDYGKDKNAYELGKPIREEAEKKANQLFNYILETNDIKWDEGNIPNYDQILWDIEKWNKNYFKNFPDLITTFTGSFINSTKWGMKKFDNWRQYLDKRAVLVSNILEIMNESSDDDLSKDNIPKDIYLKIETEINNYKESINKFKGQLNIANDTEKEQKERDNATKEAMKILKNKLTSSKSLNEIEDDYKTLETRFKSLPFKYNVKILEDYNTTEIENKLSIDLDMFEIFIEKDLSKNQKDELGAIIDVKNCSIKDKRLILNEELSREFKKWKETSLVREEKPSEEPPPQTETKTINGLTKLKDLIKFTKAADELKECTIYYKKAADELKECTTYDKAIYLIDFVNFCKEIDEESRIELCKIFDVSQCDNDKWKLYIKNNMSTKLNQWIEEKKKALNMDDNTELENFLSNNIINEKIQAENYQMVNINKLKEHIKQIKIDIDTINKEREKIKTTDSENNIITYIFSLNIYNLITYILLKNTPPKKDESEIVSQVNFKILNNIKKWESSDKTPYDLLEIVFNSKIMNLEVGKALQLDIAKEFPPNNELSESDLTIIDTAIKNYKGKIEQYREQLQIAQADYNDYGHDHNAFKIGKPIRDEAKENAKNMIENKLLTSSMIEKEFKDTYYAFQKKIGELTVTEKFYKLATQDLDSQRTIKNDGELRIELKNFIRFNKMLSENKMDTLREIFDVSKCRIEGNTLILEKELAKKFMEWKDIVPESKTDLYKYRVNGLSVGDMCNKEKLEALINDANSKST